MATVYALLCSSEDDIALAQYGSSNSGRMKTLYRQGLKHRYGSLMQIISGVHFNFSFPESFWDALFGEQDEKARKMRNRKPTSVLSETIIVLAG